MNTLISGGTSLADAATPNAMPNGMTKAAMGAISMLVYHYLGLAVLRSAWINLNTIWAVALVATGLLALAI